MIEEVATGFVKAPKILIYGRAGVGKSTCAMGAPDTVWNSAEGGEARVQGARIKRWKYADGRYIPNSWDEFIGAVAAFAKNPAADTRFYGVDGLTRAEELAAAHLCRKNGKAGLADFSYGKGYSALHNLMTEFRYQLEIINQKGIGILMVAHAHTVKLPAVTLEEQASVFGPKLQVQDKSDVMGMFVEWSDAVLYAEAEKQVATVGKDNHAALIFNEKRVLRTRETKTHGHFIAKCWSHVDATVLLDVNAQISWRNLWDQVEGGADPVKVEAEIASMMAMVSEENQRIARQHMDRPEYKEVANKVKLRGWLAKNVQIKGDNSNE